MIIWMVVEIHQGKLLRTFVVGMQLDCTLETFFDHSYVNPAYNNDYLHCYGRKNGSYCCQGYMWNKEKTKCIGR